MEHLNEWETCIDEWATRCRERDATIAALRDVIKQMGEQAAVIAKDAMAAKEQIAGLQARVQELTAEIERLKKCCSMK